MLKIFENNANFGEYFKTLDGERLISQISHRAKFLEDDEKNELGIALLDSGFCPNIYKYDLPGYYLQVDLYTTVPQDKKERKSIVWWYEIDDRRYKLLEIVLQEKYVHGIPWTDPYIR